MNAAEILCCAGQSKLDAWYPNNIDHIYYFCCNGGAAQILLGYHHQFAIYLAKFYASDHPAHVQEVKKYHERKSNH